MILNRLKRIKYWFYKKDRAFPIKIDDMKFLMSFKGFSFTDDAIIQRIEGCREPNTVVSLQSIIREDSKILEIGSCYGYFTMILSKCAKKGQIVAVECDGRYCEVLDENMDLNKVNNVKTYRRFFSAKETQLSKFLIEINFKPDILFMDIEGFEKDVLEDLLENTKLRPIILVEIHEPNYKPGFGVDWIKRLLLKHGYEYKEIGRNLICYPRK